MIPRIEDCLVCDLVRPELGGKFAILGFYGVCPNVHVELQYVDQPAVLTFVFCGTPGDGILRVKFEVLDEADGRIVAATAEGPFEATPGATTLLSSTLVMIFGRAGNFSADRIINGTERFRGRFKVSQS